MGVSFGWPYLSHGSSGIWNERNASSAGCVGPYHQIEAVALGYQILAFYMAVDCHVGWTDAAIDGRRGPEWRASTGRQVTHMIDFAEQAVVVTGAGRGLGRLYALELARRGARVVVNDRGGSMSGAGADASIADGVVEEIRTAGGVAVASHHSVDDPEEAAAIIRTATDAFGRLDAVVSNAGIYEMLPYEELTVEQWRRMLQVHLDGAFYLSQPAFRVMKDQGYGRLVFIASNIGAFGQEHAAHYAAAKGGIIGLTNALANEGADHGVLVNAVLPVGRTRMMTDSMGDREPNPILDQFFAETTAERVVPMVVYLASRSCELSHHYFSAVAGRFARVFVGVGDGWLADRETDPSVEDVADHLAAISATEPFSVPMTVADEIVAVLGQLGVI